MWLRLVREVLSVEYLLYAGTIFLGAFLLFVIEPIAGKHLLPWFGGSSSVWATSLLFFTAALFLGYLYVYLLTRFARKKQPMIHAILVMLSLAILVTSINISHSLFPSLAWVSSSAPSIGVLLALLASIGIPFVVLSTTGPLFQYWFGITQNREPYKLYALSNAASLLALVSYPLIIEPHIPLHTQENLWIGAFVAYAFLSAAVCFRILRSKVVHHHTIAHDAGAHASRVSALMRTLWVVLAALPAFMLVATTTVVTQAIAPVPLLWVIPLMIYLMTLILAFAGSGQSIAMPLALLGSVYAAYYYLTAPLDAVVPQLTSDLVLLFMSGLVCHALLYMTRPATARLPLFYLLISFGGMVGTLCASLLAPLVFTDFSEFPLGVMLSAILALWLLDPAFFPRLMSDRAIFFSRLLLSCVAIALFIQVISADPLNIHVNSISSRNFYGTATIDFAPDTTVLVHGSTMHGYQFNDAKRAYWPTTYYAPQSGVGRSVSYEEGVRGKSGLRVGVIGLGTGTMASYCRTGDTYVFYEIDQRIEKIARTYFSYLSHCAGSEVRIGDARKLIEAELSDNAPGKYDVLVVDAFSSDTIPAHLLTKEAISLYIAHLRGPDSILAIHTSNRYLLLSPIVLRLGMESGMSATVVGNSGDSSIGTVASQWVILSKNRGAFESRAFANTNTQLPRPSDTTWTDDYTALLPVLYLPALW